VNSSLKFYEFPLICPLVFHLCYTLTLFPCNFYLGLRTDVSCSCIKYFRVFSRDVTAAMLVSRNKGTGAMMVSRTNPPAIEFCSVANVLTCFRLKNMLIDHVSQNTRLEWPLTFASFTMSSFFSQLVIFAIGHFTCNLC